MQPTQSFYAARHFKCMRMKQTASVSVIAPCSLHAISIICSLKLLRSVCGGKGDVRGGEKKRESNKLSTVATGVVGDLGSYFPEGNGWMGAGGGNDGGLETRSATSYQGDIEIWVDLIIRRSRKYVSEERKV